MVSFTDFFRPLTLRTAILRYALICLLRWGLGSISWFSGPVLSYLHPFNQQMLIDLNYFFGGLYLPFGSLLSLVLSLAQIILLWRIIRLIGKDPEEVKAEQRRAGNWLSTPLLLSLIVILTCCVIGWLIQTGGRPEYFLAYVINSSSLPVLIGLGLSLLGFMFGGRFVAGAKASMGGLFGIHYLPKDHPLSQRVARHAETLGIPSAPAVGIVDVMNAFAIGTPKDSTIVLGQPLIDMITDEELDAVIGHELGHVYHNDMNRMQFAEGFQRMLGNVISATIIILVSALSRNRSDAMLGRAAGLALRQTVFVGSELVVKGISRAREFHADAVGARIASPAAMIGALERLHGLPSQPTKLESQYGYLMFRGSRLGAWFSTHPHVEKRITALRALEARLQTDSAPETVLHPKIDAMAGTAATNLGSALGTAKTGLANASASLAFADRSQSAIASASGLLGKVSLPRFNVRTAGLAIVVTSGFALAAPAIYDYYGLEERTASLQVSASATYEAVAKSLADLPHVAVATFTTYDEQLAEKDRDLKRQESLVDTLHTNLETMRTDLTQARRTADDTRAELSRITRENMRLSQGQASADANSDTIARLKAEITRQKNLVVSLRRQLAQAAAPPLRPNPLASTATEAEKLLRDRNTALTTEVAELTAEVTRQENLVVSLRRQLAQAAAPKLLHTPPSSTARETGQLLRDRNVTLTTEVETQKNAITALERDLATYKGMVKQLQEQSLGTTNEVDRFGALAASRDGIVFLTEQGFATEDAARTAAIVGCRQFSNNNSCQIRDTFSDMCAAVARVSPANRHSNWQVSYGRNQIEAEETALSECFDRYNKRCMITVPGVCAGVTR